MHHSQRVATHHTRPEAEPRHTTSEYLRITYPPLRAHTGASIAEAAAAVGDFERAIGIAEVQRGPRDRDEAIALATLAAATAGDADWTEALAGRIEDATIRAQVLTRCM
jgi:hypothetical protein